MYLNENKKRTREWFQVCDIFAPLNGTKFGFVKRISYEDEKIKTVFELTKETELSTDGGVIKNSSLATSNSSASNDRVQRTSANVKQNFSCEPSRDVSRLQTENLELRRKPEKARKQARHSYKKR